LKPRFRLFDILMWRRRPVSHSRRVPHERIRVGKITLSRAAEDKTIGPQFQKTLPQGQLNDL
jgi:hypothetical protein